MRWLLLRGLAREQRHFGAFPATFTRIVGDETRTIDLPGFGTEHHRDSPSRMAAITDDVRRRAALTDGPWSIFAISLGGMVALDWAARYPGEFARVVVANTSAADVSPPWERFTTAIWPRLPGMVRGVAAERERAILELTSNAPHVDKGALAVQWAGFYNERPPKRSSFARQLFAATRSRLPKTIGAQVLVLTSSADRLVSHRCSEKIARKLKAPLAVHGEAGHDLSLDAPEWICARIQESA